MQLASGEYFLSEEAKEKKQKERKNNEKEVDEKMSKREARYIPPQEKKWVEGDNKTKKVAFPSADEVKLKVQENMVSHIVIFIVINYYIFIMADDIRRIRGSLMMDRNAEATFCLIMAPQRRSTRSSND